MSRTRFEVGTLWAERFELRRLVGRGGMGVVYEAYDTFHDRRVAFKTMSHVSGRSIYRLKREFRALQGIRHPNLVRLGELFHHDDDWFFTMELVEGGHFVDYVRDGSSMNICDTASRLSQVLFAQAATPDPAKVRELESGPKRRTGSAVYDQGRLRVALSQVVAGLSALHRARRVHRDVKSSNIIVTPEGRAVLLDFGLIAELDDRRVATPSSTPSAQLVGTAAYMAPEQGLGEEPTPAADMYAVGVLLYEVLAGRLPFEGRMLQVMARKVKFDVEPPSTYAPDVPKDLEGLCVRLLSREPSRRPTAEEVLAELGASGVEQGAPARQVRRPTLRFVGRLAELAELERAQAQVRPDEAVAVIVRGRAGVGKSALVAQFVTRCRAASDTLLFIEGRCYEHESMPYKALDALVDRLSRFLSRLDPEQIAAWLPRDVHYLARLFPAVELVDALHLVDSPSPQLRDARQIRERAIGALSQILRRLAEDRQVVIFIDDLQWADPDSLVLLEELLRREEQPGILLVATARYFSTLAAPGKAASRFDVTFPCRTHVLELGGLNGADARCLVEQLEADFGSGKVPRDQRKRLVAEADGHPLFLQELVEYIRRHPSTSWSEPVSLEQVIAERIDALAAPARRVVEAVAVAGVPMPDDVLANAARLPRAHYHGVVDELVEARLLRGVYAEFGDCREAFHDRIREACLGRMAHAHRRSLHSELVAALRATSRAEAVPDLVVWHLVEAGRRAEAAQHARDSAERAREALAFEHAATLYRLALEFGVFDAEETRSLRVKLGDCLALAGRGHEAADQFLAVVDAHDAELQLELRRRAAEELLTSGAIERGVEVLREVLAQAQIHEASSDGEAMIRLLWNRLATDLRMGLAGDHAVERLQPHADDPEVRTRLEVHGMVAARMQMVEPLRAFDFLMRTLKMAWRHRDATWMVHSMTMAVPFLVVQGSPASDRRALELLALAHRIRRAHLDNTQTEMSMKVHEGLATSMAGHFRRACELLESAERWFRNQPGGGQCELNHTRVYWLFALRHMGDLPRLRQLVERFDTDAERRDDFFMKCSLRHEGSIVWLMADQPDEAMRQIDSVSWPTHWGKYHTQQWFEAKARVELCLYRYEAGECFEQFDAELAEWAGTMLMNTVQMSRARFWWTWGRLILAAHDQRGDLGSELHRVEELAEKLEAEVDRCFAAVWAQLLRAGICAGRGEYRAAVEWLEVASCSARDSDMAVCAEGARLQLARLVGGRRGQRLSAEALEALRRAEVVDPVRFADMLVPVSMREAAAPVLARM